MYAHIFSIINYFIMHEGVKNININLRLFSTIKKTENFCGCNIQKAKTSQSDLAIQCNDSFLL